MSRFRFSSLSPAALPLAALLFGCSGCGEERESRRIDIGTRPAAERPAPAGGTEPAPAEETAPVGDHDADPPAGSEPVLADTDTAGTPADDGTAPPDAGDTEPTAAVSGTPATGVGAPP